VHTTSDIDRVIFSKRRFLEDASHATLSREPPVDGPSVKKNLIRSYVRQSGVPTGPVMGVA
jgi:hypothetical protein